MGANYDEIIEVGHDEVVGKAMVFGGMAVEWRTEWIMSKYDD